MALSFVLALLLYKHAPFYILDEVDAALDLSHTENIGIKKKNYNLQLLLKRSYDIKQFSIIIVYYH